MIIEIIGILLLVLALAYIVNIIRDVNNKTSLSFREAMDLVELPVITFYNEDKKLNFLLDTGSTHSHINSAIINQLNLTKIAGMREVSGVEGNSIKSNLCFLKIKYRNDEFSDEFIITDLDTTFEIIKNESGVTLHGILGSAFFKKYEYVLDFKELTASYIGKGN